MTTAIDCPHHGNGTKAFLCMHLIGQHKERGFYHPHLDFGYPDIAWCGFCEILRTQFHHEPGLDPMLGLLQPVCQTCFNDVRASRRRRRPILTSNKKIMTEANHLPKTSRLALGEKKA